LGLNQNGIKTISVKGEQMPARVITLANNKGGVTKTTTTVNLGYGLARAGKRTLVIDTDAQSNSTWSLLRKILKGPKGTVYEAIMKKKPLHELITPTDDPNLFIIPSSLWMGYAEAKLFNEPMREQKLRNALRPYLSKFDYVLIDTPPNLGLVTINAFFACTDIIIPITLNGYSLLGISIMLNTIKDLKRNAEENEINAPMLIFGVITTQVRDTKDASKHLANVKSYFGELVFDTRIPLNVKVEEANNKGSLYELFPDSSGAQGYASFVQEVIKRDEEARANYEAYTAKTQAIFDMLPDEEEGDEVE
jgi:chromosome partitioning protein